MSIDCVGHAECRDAYECVRPGPCIMRSEYVGTHKPGEATRFKITVFKTRFDGVECFAYDAHDIGDEQVKQGLAPEPFTQGSWNECWKAIEARYPS